MSLKYFVVYWYFSISEIIKLIFNTVYCGVTLVVCLCLISFCTRYWIVRKFIIPSMRYKLYAYSESCLFVEFIKDNNEFTIVSIKYGICGSVNSTALALPYSISLRRMLNVFSNTCGWGSLIEKEMNYITAMYACLLSIVTLSRTCYRAYFLTLHDLCIIICQ